MNKKYLSRIVGMFIFLVAVILGMILFGGKAWADLEATFYGFEVMPGGRLPSMHCPIIITSSEQGTVSATFSNPNDTPIDFQVRADISSRGLFRSEPKKIHLEGHKKETASWNVSSADIDLRNFIFVQITNFPAQKIPFRHSTCGIMVLNLNLLQLTGKQLFIIAMIVILVGILAGLFIWEKFGQPLAGKLPEITRAMNVLGILVLVGMLFSFAGSWLIAVLIFAISVLAIGVILGFVFAS